MSEPYSGEPTKRAKAILDKQKASEITGRLEDWYAYHYCGTHMVLWGRVFDDIKERFQDGLMIHTSAIECDDVSSFHEGDVVTTLNSTYLLGRPSPFEQ